MEEVHRYRLRFCAFACYAGLFSVINNKMMEHSLVVPSFYMTAVISGTFGGFLPPSCVRSGDALLERIPKIEQTERREENVDVIIETDVAKIKHQLARNITFLYKLTRRLQGNKKGGWGSQR